ncbi:MAG: sulfatase [Actinomycetota bacterium]|nr:sulfatase [Actinomycetota bacterium]
MAKTFAGIVVCFTLLAQLLVGASGVSKARPPVPPADEERPNILLFVTDDQRAQGTMAVLPAVRRWFGEQGTEFTNTYATTPLCCPSRASILTGRYPHNHGVRQNGLDAVKHLNFAGTLPAYLQRAGYRTAMFGKYFNKWPRDRAPRHFDRWAISSHAYENARFGIGGREKVVPGYATHFISDRATNFVEDASREREPWFLYVAPLAPHAPFTPERAYKDAPLPERIPDPSEGEEDLSDKPPWVANHRLVPLKRTEWRYRGQMRTLMSVNDMVDRVMTKLDAVGEAENTLAIFMSDNGFLWGEHGLGNKRQPYLPSIEVPLFVRWPQHFAAGATDTRLAANVDITPTVLEAAGVSRKKPLDGLSLLADEQRRMLFLEYESDFGRPGRLPSWAAVLTHTEQYIEYYSESGVEVFREYYDLLRDPAQLVNLLADADGLNDPPAPLLDLFERAVERGKRCRGRSCTMSGAPLSQ